MIQRSIQMVLWVVGVVILVAALAFGGWSLWTLSKQLKTLSAQQTQANESLQTEIKKLGVAIEAVSNQQAEAISACEQRSKDSLAVLGETMDQTTDQLLETQTQEQDRVSSLETSLGTLEQEQKKLAESQTQLDQTVEKNQAQAAGQFTNADQELAALKKRMATCVVTEADWHFFAGLDNWDDRDLNGAIKQFTRVVRSNNDEAVTYYNLALSYWRDKQLPQACQNAYQSAQCYLRQGDIPKANRMLKLLSTIDSTSALIEKLRQEIAAKRATPESPAKAEK